MTVLYKVQAKWQGFPGAPGYTNFYLETTDPLLEGAQEAADAVRAFFQALNGFLSTTVNVTVQPLVETIDDTDGELQDSLTVTTPPTVVTGTSGSAYAGPAGACFTWKTAGIVAGRHVRGRTFLVPMAVNQYDTDGTITSGALTIMNTAATNYRTTSGISPVVWHRPTGTPASGGSSFPITAHSISDRAAYLSSRRD